MGYSPQTKYRDQAPVNKQTFWFTGSTALTAGYCLCYDSNRGTATSSDQTRWAYVEAPTQDNNNAFAGVIAASKAAVTGGQEVELYLPGSVCPCYVSDASVTLGDYLTFYVGSGSSAGAAQGTPLYAGTLSTAGYMGAGTVEVLQTLSAAGLALCRLCDGPQSGMCEHIVPAASGGAVILTSSGYTYCDGGTVASAHATFTLGAPKFPGQKKSILITTTVGGSKNLVVTLTPTGIKLAKTGALTTLTFNTAAETSTLVAYDEVWMNTYSVGTTEA